MNAAASATKYPLPNVAQVKDLFGILFDGLAVKPGAKLDTSPKSGSYFGVYVTDDGIPGAMYACDIAFAANGGAALSMLPPNVAKEAMKSKVLTDVMLANLREVMNIGTRLVLVDGSPHLRLDQVYAGPALPAPAAALLGAIKGRADFEITLGKYGSGLFAILAF
jgi:hypothetical protein